MTTIEGFWKLLQKLATSFSLKGKHITWNVVLLFMVSLQEERVWSFIQPVINPSISCRLMCVQVHTRSQKSGYLDYASITCLVCDLGQSEKHSLAHFPLFTESFEILRWVLQHCCFIEHYVSSEQLDTWRQMDFWLNRVLTVNYCFICASPCAYAPEVWRAVPEPCKEFIFNMPYYVLSSAGWWWSLAVVLNTCWTIIRKLDL